MAEYIPQGASMEGLNLLSEDKPAEIVEVKVKVAGKEYTLKLTSELPLELYEQIFEFETEDKAFFAQNRAWLQAWFSVETDPKIAELVFKRMTITAYQKISTFSLAFFKAISEQKKS